MVEKIFSIRIKIQTNRLVASQDFLSHIQLLKKSKRKHRLADDMEIFQKISLKIKSVFWWKYSELQV